MDSAYVIQGFIQIATVIVLVATQVVHFAQGHLNLIAFSVNTLTPMQMDLNVNVKKDTMLRPLHL